MTDEVLDEAPKQVTDHEQNAQASKGGIMEERKLIDYSFCHPHAGVWAVLTPTALTG